MDGGFEGGLPGGDDGGPVESFGLGLGLAVIDCAGGAVGLGQTAVGTG